MNDSDKIYRVNDQGMIVEEIDELDEIAFDKLAPKESGRQAISDNVVTAH